LSFKDSIWEFHTSIQQRPEFKPYKSYVGINNKEEFYEGINSFNLVRSITGFDLYSYSFLQRNSKYLKKEIDNIFSNF
jgi:hypothetical protein